MIDVVGHFGSRLSYATIAEEVTRGLGACDALGNLINLDDKWVSDRPVRYHGERGKKVLVLSDPQPHLIESLVDSYGGRENVAIFACPNTNKLSDDRLRACRMVGRIYTPSRWCETTLAQYALGSAECMGFLVTMPLGVDECFARDRRERAPGRFRYLHVTTDTFWPGRKGTEELITAWKLFDSRSGCLLTIHCLEPLVETVVRALAEADIDVDVGDGAVRVMSSPARGTESAELLGLFHAHDVLVAPSRSEGFGIMPLSALCCGMPVLTTAGTGQDEYLYASKALPGGWLQIPTRTHAELAGEEGLAPRVDPQQLAFTLSAAEPLFFDLKNEAGFCTDDDGIPGSPLFPWWSWSARRDAWATDLIEWEKET